MSRSIRRKEFAARVWSKLVAFEKSNGLLASRRKVLAAVSGGPDSVVLAHWLWVQRRRFGFDLELLHVNHGLRGKSADADAKFVRDLGARLGLDVTVVETDVAARARETGKGLEDAGRLERYRALSARAKKGRFDAVATGHQLDDQAETVLLHLLRGTSLEGLGGIVPKRPLAGGVDLIRPLLPITRAEIMAYLEIHGLDWREDLTNRNVRFTRNWVRHEAIPLLESRAPGLKRRLSQFAEKARAASRRTP